MQFNSVRFLIFFAAVFLCYALLSDKAKKDRYAKCLLLAASLYFYACWKAAYLFLILASVTITWLSGLGMEKFPGRKKLVLALSLVLNLAILFFFKYYNWLAATASLPLLSIALPVGISFYTFQAIGYSVDVYRGTLRAERDFITYALFVTFFPQLVAGPIERAGNLLPQLKARYDSDDYSGITDGLKLMAWGLFLKVVIADRMAVYVNSVYRYIDGSYGTALLLATVCFAVQVYADFAGYSDIAIGAAQVLGFRLMKNFDHPYFSASVPEFWRRWHISLSGWLRDYVYIPLGGSRVSKPRHWLNLMATFIISGIWHGAAWHFVAWGMLHGACMVASNMTAPLRKKIRLALGLDDEQGTRPFWKPVQVLITFTLVCAGWVFFRASGLGQALKVFRKFLAIPSELAMAEEALYTAGDTGPFLAVLMMNKKVTGVGVDFMLVNLLLCLVLFMASLITRHTDGRKLLSAMPAVIRWPLYWALVAVILIFRSLVETEFLYFQF